MKFLLFLGLTLLGACTPPDNSTGSVERAENFILHPCPGFAETGTPPIVQGAECGMLAVKENPRDESSRDIHLYILRLPAISSTPEVDPLFIIAGGPGQSAVQTAEHIFYTFNEVRKHRDLVFVDQRGTGKSNPLACLGTDDFVDQLSMLEHKQRLKKAVADCVLLHGEQLEFYTTPYAVQDLEIIRKKLGYPRINLWGVSYGTRVALEYMRRFPTVIRTSVLDGVAPVAMALPWFAEEDALASLMQLNQQCSASAECRNTYGDILLKAEAVAQKLLVKPVEISATHPRTQAPLNLTINHQTFAAILRMALYSRDTAILVPLAIANAYAQDYQLLASLIAMIEEQGELMNISHAMHYTILCNEDYPQYKARDFSASQQFLQLNWIATMGDICELWPSYSLPDDYFTPIVSEVPSLLLSGQRDPITPPRWAELIMPYLSKATHLIAPGGHHSITRDGCVARLIAQFIYNGGAGALDTACVNDILPLPPYLRIETATADKDTE